MATSNPSPRSGSRSRSGSRRSRAEANRENAQKSTGPRTPEGKAVSRFNALKHGLTARVGLLPSECVAELTSKQNALVDDMRPRNALEALLLERIGSQVFRSERADRAGIALAAQRIRHESIDRANQESEEALRLGDSLFWQCAAPVPIDTNPEWVLGKPPHADDSTHPTHPDRLVLRLEQTLAGCDWLLEQWSKLDERLNRNSVWRALDGFQMVRLLGKHAVSLEDDFDVARVLLGSLLLTGQLVPGPETCTYDWAFALILMMMSFHVEDGLVTLENVERSCRSFRHRLLDLPIDKFAPSDHHEAQKWITAKIEAEKTRIGKIRAHLNAIAHFDRAEAPFRLAYETGLEGEQFRRYVVSNERLVLRTVDEFLKVRSAGDLFDASTLEPISSYPDGEYPPRK